jgi:hypothetical protein
MQKLLLFLLIPLLLTVPFFYFNKWLKKRLRPADRLRNMGLYLLIIIPIGFILVTLCIYIILNGYVWMQSD